MLGVQTYCQPGLAEHPCGEGSMAWIKSKANASLQRGACLRQGAAHLEGGCRCSPGRMGCLGVGDPLLKDPEVLPVLCATAGNLCSALSKQQPTNEGCQVLPQLNRRANLEGMSIVWTESKGTVVLGLGPWISILSSLDQAALARLIEADNQAP